MNFKRIAKSLTGFSTPVFGISWQPPESDREIVRKLITFFEDRRALYDPYDIEMPQYVERSVLEIRKELTKTLQKLEDDSDISLHLRAMRAACRKFMNETGKPIRLRFRFSDFEFFAALGELRAIFGIHIAQLSVKYGIDVEDDLVMILPIADEQNRKTRIKRQ